METLNKNIENQISNSKSFTIAIGDDKVLLPTGEWGTTQSFYDCYSSPIVDDLMTEAEAQELAEKTNVENELGFFDDNNKYHPYPRFAQYYVVQIGKVKFDLKDLSKC